VLFVFDDGSDGDGDVVMVIMTMTNEFLIYETFLILPDSTYFALLMY